MADQHQPNEILQALVEAGMLKDGDYVGDTARFVKDLQSILAERDDFRSQLEKLTSGQDESGNGKPEGSAKPDGKAAAKSKQTTEADPVITTAESLRAAGIISKVDGKWVSSDPSFAPHASALNSRDDRIGQIQGRAMSLLSESPDKFVEEFLGNALEGILASKIEQAVAPFKEQIEHINRTTVKQQTEFEKFVDSHRADLENTKSPLRQAYNRLSEEVSSQLESQGIKGKLDEKLFSSLVHSMVADRALAEAAKDKSGAGSEGGSSADIGKGTSESSRQSTSQQTADTRSVFERIADGEEIEEGPRNNGRTGGRTLNEHASQIGDASIPVKSNGKPDFMAIAAGVAKERGIRF